MTWDEYYKKLLEKQPKITWDEYYETAPISRDYYTTEQLYNPYAKPKKKYSSSDFEPLGVEWKYDWKKYGDYDETSVEDQLRKLRNLPPASVIETYDFEDSEDKKRFKQGLPSKSLERQELSQKAKKEAEQYLTERKKRFLDAYTKAKEDQNIFAKMLKRPVKVEYEEPDLPESLAAWRGYAEKKQEYEDRLADMTEEELAYLKAIGKTPKEPEELGFDIPYSWEELFGDPMEVYKSRIEALEEKEKKEKEEKKAEDTARKLSFGYTPEELTEKAPEFMERGEKTKEFYAEKLGITPEQMAKREEKERERAFKLKDWQDSREKRREETAYKYSPEGIMESAIERKVNEIKKPEKEDTDEIEDLSPTWQKVNKTIDKVRDSQGYKFFNRIAQGMSHAMTGGQFSDFADIESNREYVQILNEKYEQTKDPTRKKAIAELIEEYDLEADELEKKVTTNIKALNVIGDIVGSLMGLRAPQPGTGKGKIDIFSDFGEGVARTIPYLSAKAGVAAEAGVQASSATRLGAAYVKGVDAMLNNSAVQAAIKAINTEVGESAVAYAGTFVPMTAFESLIEGKELKDVGKDTAASIIPAIVMGAARPAVQAGIYHGTNRVLDKIMKDYVSKFADEKTKRILMTEGMLANEVISSFGGSAVSYALFQIAQQPFVPKEERQAITEIAKDSTVMGLVGLTNDLVSGRIDVKKYKDIINIYKNAVPDPAIYDEAEIRAILENMQSPEMNTLKKMAQKFSSSGDIDKLDKLRPRWTFYREELNRVLANENLDQATREQVLQFANEMESAFSGKWTPPKTTTAKKDTDKDKTIKMLKGGTEGDTPSPSDVAAIATKTAKEQLSKTQKAKTVKDITEIDLDVIKKAIKDRIGEEKVNESAIDKIAKAAAEKVLKEMAKEPIPIEGAKEITELDERAEEAMEVKEEAIEADEDVIEADEEIEEAPEEKPATQTLDTWIESVSKEDIDISTAEDAYYWNSMDPQKRAERDREDYVQELEQVYKKFSPMAKTPEQKEELVKELDRYKERYLRYKNELLSRHSKIASPAVTGPARFDNEKNQKAIDSYRKKYEEFQEWKERAESAIEKKFRPEVKEDVRLKKEADEAIKIISAIKSGELRGYDVSAFRNSLRGKLERSADNGNVKEVENILDYIKEKQDELGVVVFAPNNSIWKYPEKAREKLALEDEKRAQGENVIKSYDGVDVVENFADDRVQIYFDEKPDEEVRNELKSHGWKWSRTNGAWQRKITGNAKQNAQSILDKYYSETESLEVKKVGKQELESVEEPAIKTKEEKPVAEKELAEEPVAEKEKPVVKEEKVTKEKKPVTKEEKPTTGTESEIQKLDVNEISVDPKRFQFKQDVDRKTGASKTLDIEKWDENLAGVILVWEDKNGEKWVVNGHHRLQKAKELGVKDIHAKTIKEEDGYSEKDARTIGAKINIAEGHGTITDAAKLFREGGFETIEDLIEEGLPLGSGNAKKGLYLSKLCEPLFLKVVNKELTENKGAILGEILPSDDGQNDAKQIHLYKKIEGKQVNNDTLREMAEAIRDADAQATTQTTLFGDVLVWNEKQFEIKPRLIADTKKIITSDRQAFNKAISSAETLESAGNILKSEENIKRKRILESALEVIDKGKNVKGDPINDIFNKYADAIAHGMPKKQAADLTTKEIIKYLMSSDYVKDVTKVEKQVDISSLIKEGEHELDTTRDQRRGGEVPETTSGTRARTTEAGTGKGEDYSEAELEEGDRSQKITDTRKNAEDSFRHGIESINKEYDGQIKNARLLEEKELTEEQKTAQEAVKILTGLDVNFYDSDSELGDEGFAIGDNIYVRNDAEDSWFVATHEAMHVIQNVNPELYRELLDTVGDITDKQVEAYISSLDASDSYKNQIKGNTERIKEEMINDVIANSIAGTNYETFLTDKQMEALLGKYEAVMQTFKERIEKDPNLFIDKDGTVKFSIEETEQGKEIKEKLLENHPALASDDRKDDLRNALEAIAATLQIESIDIDTAGNKFPVKETGGVRTLAHAVSEELIHKGYIDFRGRKINSAHDVAVLSQVFRDPRYETFRIIFTKGNEVVGYEGVTSRVPSITMIMAGMPSTRAIVEEAEMRGMSEIAVYNQYAKKGFYDYEDKMKRLGADGYYLVHNHPSGDVTLSKPDKYTTVSFAQKLPGFRGHIVINHDKYSVAVLNEEGTEVDVQTLDLDVEGEDPLKKPSVDHPLLNVRIPGTDAVAKIMAKIETDPDYTCAIYVNTKGRLKGIQEIPNNMVLKGDIRGFLRNRALEFGARAVYLGTNDKDVYEKGRDLVRELYVADIAYMQPGSEEYKDSGFPTFLFPDIWMGREVDTAYSVFDKGIETMALSTRKQDGWELGKSYNEIKKDFPALFSALPEKGLVDRHPSQITGTKATYATLYGHLAKSGFKGEILDASSGLGHGTKIGRAAGFKIDDVEPFPDKNYNPKYRDYDEIDKKYDAIISNYVLNVIPQDVRDGLVLTIGNLLKPGGTAYITVRGSDVLGAKTKIPIDADNWEFFIPKKNTYQKGFKKKELVNYLKETLGEGYEVEPMTKANSGLKNKVGAVVTKKPDALDLNISFSMRRSLQDESKTQEEKDKEAKQRLQRLKMDKETLGAVEKVEGQINEIETELEKTLTEWGQIDDKGSEKALALQLFANDLNGMLKKHKELLDELHKKKVTKKSIDEVKRLIDTKESISELKEKHKKEIELVKEEYREKEVLRMKKEKAEQAKQELRRIETSARKKLLDSIKELERLKKQKSSTKLMPAFEDAANELLELLNIDTTSISMNPKTKAKLEKTKEYIEQKKKEDPLYDPPASLLDRIDRLEKTQIIDLSIEEVETIQDVIDHIIHQNKLQYNLFVEGKWEDQNISKAQFVNTVKQTRKPKDIDAVTKSLGKYPPHKYLFGSGAMELDVLVTRLLSGNTNNRFYYHMSQAFDKAVHEEYGYIMADQRYYEELTKGVDTKGWHGKKSKKFTLKLPNYGEFELDRGDRMMIYLHLKTGRQENIEGLMNGFRRAGEAKHITGMTKADLQFIADSITPEEKKIADGIYDWFNEETYKDKYGEVLTSKGRINKGSIATHGYRLANEKNYVRIIRDKDYMSRKYGARFKTVESFSWTKPRTPGATDPMILEDPFRLFKTMSEETAKYASWIGPMHNAKRIMGDPMVSNTIKQYFGDHINTHFADFFYLAEGNKRELSPFGEAYMKGLRNVQNAILASPWIWVNQLGSIPLAAAELDVKYAPKAVFTQLSKDVQQKMEQYAPSLWMRREGMAFTEVGELTKTLDRQNPLMKRLTSVSGKMVSLFDVIAINHIWAWTDNQIKHEYPNLSEEEHWKKVAEKATQVVQRTQPNYTAPHRSLVGISDDPLIKTGFMFSTVPNKIYNMMIRADTALRWGKNKEYYETEDATAMTEDTIAIEKGMDENAKKRGKEYGIKTLFAVLAGALTLTARNYFRSIWQKEKMDEKEIAKDIAANIVSSVYGFNEITRALMGYDIGTPTDLLFNQISNGVYGLLEEGAKEEPSPARVRGHILKLSVAISQFAGIPARVVERELENVLKNANWESYYKYKSVYSEPRTLDYYPYLVSEIKAGNEKEAQELMNVLVDLGTKPSNWKNSKWFNELTEVEQKKVRDLYQKSKRYKK